MKARIAALSLTLAAPLTMVKAQAPADSLRLPALRAAALTNDPRTRELELLASQSTLRLRNIDVELRPSFSFESQGQYQSAVASIPLELPGVSVPRPPHDTYDAKVIVQQRLYDPSTVARRALERAQDAEAQARVRSTLYPITESVTAAFFTALRSQTQIAELETTLTDLEAQLAVASERVKAGTALRSEVNVLRAELLRRRQAVAEQKAARRAAIAILSDLTGQRVDENAPLAAPELEKEATDARNRLASLRARPEFEQFARSRAVLEQMENARVAQDRPRVLAFGRLGYGRPGLNPLNSKFDSYWLGGVQLQWNPFNWGTTQRDRQVNRLQREIVTSEERAFIAQLTRAVEQDLASIDRLQSALADDDQIIALRESILDETRPRFREGVITSAEYVDRQTDVLSARISRATHRVELAQARAHLLTTLGIEVR